jgi:hypothetical protein
VYGTVAVPAKAVFIMALPEITALPQVKALKDAEPELFESSFLQAIKHTVQTKKPGQIKLMNTFFIVTFLSQKNAD